MPGAQSVWPSAEQLWSKLNQAKMNRNDQVGDTQMGASREVMPLSGWGQKGPHSQQRVSQWSPPRNPEPVPVLGRKGSALNLIQGLGETKQRGGKTGRGRVVLCLTGQNPPIQTRGGGGGWPSTPLPCIRRSCHPWGGEDTHAAQGPKNNAPSGLTLQRSWLCTQKKWLHCWNQRESLSGVAANARAGCVRGERQMALLGGSHGLAGLGGESGGLEEASGMT